MGTMSLCLAEVVALLFLDASITGGLAFPARIQIQNSPRNIVSHGASNIADNDQSRRHLLKNNVSRLSMVTDDNSDSDAEGSNDDMTYPIPLQPHQSQQSENIPSEFDEHINWEPMDFDDMDDFLATLDYPGDEFVDIDDAGELLQEFDKETLLEILGLEDDGETITIPEEDHNVADPEQFKAWDDLISSQSDTQTKSGIDKGMENLERALARGVVPADAGVGSGILPGDQGFDPWELSTKDYFQQTQNFILKLFPKTKNGVDDENPEVEPEAGGAMPTVGFVGEEERPPALILRDYREAEIRHGRLAMLAAVIWPLQEILDRIFIPETFGSTTVPYGGLTLPFLPLLMTFSMLNLGYLDIYSSEIKDYESGDAFLPGECFWDPLCVMEGAPDSMKRNMQERELLNGRAAMIAVAAYLFEETMTHKPIVALPTNALLFVPAYQVPFIQEWLDLQFGNIDYTTNSIIDHGLWLQ